MNTIREKFFAAGQGLLYAIDPAIEKQEEVLNAHLEIIWKEIEPDISRLEDDKRLLEEKIEEFMEVIIR